MPWTSAPWPPHRAQSLAPQSWGTRCSRKPRSCLWPVACGGRAPSLAWTVGLENDRRWPEPGENVNFSLA
jgi:hypothetical protein